MKKIWKYAILLVALSALLCMSAFAVDSPDCPDVTILDKTNAEVWVKAGYESFGATYKGTVGSQYLIIMLESNVQDKMPDPTVTKILYVNQAQAGEDGVVEFDNVYPSTVEDSVIWLTGGDAPVALASIDVPDPVGVTVSGTAASWNSTDDAVYLLYADTVEDATIKAEWKAGTYATAGNVVYTGTKGTITAATVETKSMQAQPFSFAGVANGTYKLAIFKPGKYVPKIVTVTVSGSDVDMGTQKLWLYGDVSYDGTVNATDSTQILRHFNNKSPNAFANGSDQDKIDRSYCADVNNDGSINATDATQILRFFNNKIPNAFTNLK